MGVTSGCGDQEAGVASGSWWNLCVWLLGVVVRRYIDFLILLIPTPLVSVLFYSSIPAFYSFKKCFSLLLQYFFVITFYVLNTFSTQYKHTYGKLRAYHGSRMKHTQTYASYLEVTTIEDSQVTLATDETAAIEESQVTLAPDNEEQPSYSQLSTQAGPSQLQSTQAGPSQLQSTQAGPSQLQSTQAGPSQQNTQPGSETEDRPGRKRPRKASKLDRVEKSNKVMMDKFLEAQEKSRMSFLELEEKRMKMEEERERREDSKDEHFLTFMREMFTMMAPPNR